MGGFGARKVLRLCPSIVRESLVKKSGVKVTKRSSPDQFGFDTGVGTTMQQRDDAKTAWALLGALAGLLPRCRVRRRSSWKEIKGGANHPPS
eukprot:scaffold7349_cov173-Amphora_coffeaeformis.AAC.96